MLPRCCQGAVRLSCALARQLVAQGSSTVAASASTSGAALPVMVTSNSAISRPLQRHIAGAAWSGTRGLPPCTTAAAHASSFRACTTLVEERPPSGGAAPVGKITAPPAGRHGEMCGTVQAWGGLHAGLIFVHSPLFLITPISSGLIHNNARPWCSGLLSFAPIYSDHTPPLASRTSDTSGPSHEVKPSMGRVFRGLPAWSKAWIAWGALSAAWVAGQLLFWAIDVALQADTVLQADEPHGRGSAGESGTKEASVARDLFSTLSSVTASIQSTLLRWASQTEQALTRQVDPGDGVVPGVAMCEPMGYCLSRLFIPVSPPQDRARLQPCRQAGPHHRRQRAPHPRVRRSLCSCGWGST